MTTTTAKVENPAGKTCPQCRTGVLELAELTVPAPGPRPVDVPGVRCNARCGYCRRLDAGEIAAYVR